MGGFAEMRFCNKRAQTSFEMIVIIGAIVLPVAYIVGSFFSKYISMYSDNLLRANIQCEVRYGLGDCGSSTTALSNMSAPAVAYVQGGTASKHPLKNVNINW
jgi:hypothetical protein